MINTIELASKKVNLKKVSSKNGGEWAGPCPSCGGNDRFHVWPDQHDGKGAYWCRSCGIAGDNIQFLIEFEGMDFKAACEYLNINIENHRMERPAEIPKPEFTPSTHQNPDQLWQEKAEKFVTWAEGNLKQNKEALDWLAARGINQQAAESARLGWNPGENGRDVYRARAAWGLPVLKKEDGKPRMLWIPQGLVIPYSVDGIIQRIRVRRTEGEPRYYVVPGSSMATMIIGIESQAFVIVENELDAIACASSTDMAGAVALGFLEGKPDAAAYQILKSAVQILNALDYGDKGGGKKAAERAFEWWQKNFPDRCDRWPVPKGKDPGEAFALGIELGKWIKAGLPPVLTIARQTAGQSTGNNQSTVFKGGQRGILTTPPEGTSPLLAELYKLLSDNPGVKIINAPDRYTVLRNDRYVGGRINDLVMREEEVREYLLTHPDQQITWENLFKGENACIKTATED